MSVLTLFDDIQVNASEVMISQRDKLFCERTKEELDEVVNQLKSYQRGLEELEQSLPKLNPATMSKYGSGRPYVEENRNERSHWGCEYAFTPAYSKLFISKSLESIKQEFVSQIIDYFNENYNLDFHLSSKEKENSLPDNVSCWEPYVDRIVAHAGGSLSDAGIKNLINDFRGEFNHDRKKVALKGNTITIQRCYLRDSFSNYMDIHSSSMKALLSAIGYFETGSTSTPNYIRQSFPCWHNDEIDYSSFREASPLCEKFAAHKYYQNKRLDLKFHSAEAAREFHTMFFY